MAYAVQQARFNMVYQQIRPWEVLDRRVLDCLLATPREVCVPDAYRDLAYADLELPIGEGQYMLAPKLVARLLQALDVQPRDRVLEIGTGTGYLTACLAHLGGQVVSLEIHPGLLEMARANLAQLGLGNLELRAEDGLRNPSDSGSFDVIAVTGALPEEDSLAHFQNQLALGGRLFAVVGEAPLMEALLITRMGETTFRRESLLETCIPPLVNRPRPKAFVF